MGAINHSLSIIARHGYLVLFVWITAEQLGLPIPAVPILIAAGVLAAAGQLSFMAALLLAVAGCLIGDTVWFVIGRQRGTAVLRTLCRISLEPDTCVRRSSTFISKYGRRSLLFAKFIPGISTVAVPLTANSGVSSSSFAVYDLLGSTTYVAAYLAVGRILGARLDKLSRVAHSISSLSVSLAIMGALAIVGWRFQQRRKFFRELEMARITPLELRELIEGGQQPFIVDLRHSLDVLPEPRVIPGALRLLPDELAARHEEIPRDREIILYCT